MYLKDLMNRMGVGFHVTALWQVKHLNKKGWFFFLYNEYIIFLTNFCRVLFCFTTLLDDILVGIGFLFQGGEKYITETEYNVFNILLK